MHKVARSAAVVLSAAAAHPRRHTRRTLTGPGAIEVKTALSDDLMFENGLTEIVEIACRR